MITCQGSFEPWPPGETLPSPPGCPADTRGTAPRVKKGKIPFHNNAIIWTGSHSNSLCPAKPDNRTVMVHGQTDPGGEVVRFRSSWEITGNFGLLKSGIYFPLDNFRLCKLHLRQGLLP